MAGNIGRADGLDQRLSEKSQIAGAMTHPYHHPSGAEDDMLKVELSFDSESITDEEALGRLRAYLAGVVQHERHGTSLGAILFS